MYSPCWSVKIADGHLPSAIQYRSNASRSCVTCRVSVHLTARYNRHLLALPIGLSVLSITRLAKPLLPLHCAFASGLVLRFRLCFALLRPLGQ